MRIGLVGSDGSRRAVAALVVGFLHAGVAASLWARFGFDDLRELVTVKPLVGGYMLLGMFALGFVPALLYAGRRLVSPAAVVGALLVLSVLGSVRAGPVRAPAGSPTPFGFYLLLWVGVVALAALAGRLERTWHRQAAG